MSACFLTHHGTFLCFGTGQAEFHHVALDEVDPTVLLTADASAASIRAGRFDGQPFGIRPQSGARLGLPRALGGANGHRRPAVAIVWRGSYLCAGGAGGTILSSERVSDWEEFLPIPVEDVILLRSFAGGGWEMERHGRPIGAGAVRLEPNFTLRVGDLAFDLRQMPSLGGDAALKRGRASLLVDGWRIEKLRRYAPLVVWRHDGSDNADDEIVLGLRSMASCADVRVLVETSLAETELRARVPRLDGIELEVRLPPEGRRGLLQGLVEVSESATPVLFLANGVLCRGRLEPLLRALARERELALLAWRWTPDGQGPSEGPAFFADDPSESAGAVACSAAVIGVPDNASMLFRLIGTIAANRLQPEDATDWAENDLLRYVLAREGGGCTRLLDRYVRTGADAPAGTAVLLNLRPVPSEGRLSRMRALLDEAA